MLKKINILFATALIYIVPLLLSVNGFDLNFNIDVYGIFLSLGLIVLALYLVLQNKETEIMNLYAIVMVSVVPLFLFEKGVDSYNYVKAYYTWIISAVMLLTFLIYIVKNRIKFYIADLFILIFGAFLTISFLMNGQYLRALRGQVYRYDGYLASVSYLIIVLIVSKFYNFRKWHLNLLAISSFLIALYGIGQYFGIDYFHDLSKVEWGYNVISTLGHRDFFGSYITIVLPIFIFLYIYSGKIKYAVVSSMLFFSMLIIYVRSAWVAFPVYVLLLLFYVFRFKMKKVRFVHLCAVFLILTLSVNFFGNNGVFSRVLSMNKDAQSVVSGSDTDSAGSDRLFIWKRAVTLIPEHPIIGVGPDNFMNPFMKKFKKDVDERYSAYKGAYGIDKAHNEYLQIAVCTGVPSLICYLCFVGIILLRGMKKSKGDIMIVPLVLSVMGYLIQAFFNISVVSVAPVFFGILGILYNFLLKDYSIEEIMTEKFSLKEIYEKI